jgi:hypothetical protein
MASGLPCLLGGCAQGSLLRLQPYQAVHIHIADYVRMSIESGLLQTCHKTLLRDLTQALTSVSDQVVLCSTARRRRTMSHDGSKMLRSVNSSAQARSRSCGSSLARVDGREPVIDRFRYRRPGERAEPAILTSRGPQPRAGLPSITVEW